jgi:hypothetical protein
MYMQGFIRQIAQLKVLLIVQYRCGVSPYTSSMPRLVWNANLAAVAQRFVLSMKSPNIVLPLSSSQH